MESFIDVLTIGAVWSVVLYVVYLIARSKDAENDDGVLATVVCVVAVLVLVVVATLITLA